MTKSAMPYPFFLALAAILLVVYPGPGTGQTLTKEQRGFLDAREALDHGLLKTFRRLSDELRDYPLHPYLEYEYLRKYLRTVDAQAVRSFLSEHPDLPVAKLLRRAWLRQLAWRGQWSDYLRDYDGDSDTELHCHYLAARLKAGPDESVWEDVAGLWRVGFSQPSACDPVFAAWQEAGRMERDHVLARIELAMESGRLGLVSYLSRFLGESDRKWVEHWKRMHRRPDRELGRLKRTDVEWSARLFSYGVRRLARSQPVKADHVWRTYRGRYSLTDKAARATERAIALNLAYDREALAIERLASLSSKSADPGVWGWYLRSALWYRDWKAVLKAIGSIPASERSETDWVYWKARALDELGRADEARPYYVLASNCRCYYGFLAAERLGRPPALGSVPLHVEKRALKKLAVRPMALRAREFLTLGLLPEARREWRELIEPMNSEQLKTAAKLADSWGWHHQAILTLGRTDVLSDLELRFPTPFQEEVMAAAEQRELDSAFVYAVMRQESAFSPDARSRAGALGLMQLMPSTARRTARQFSYPVPSNYDLLSADNNINLGTAHLRQLLNRYEGNLLYTVAAYNAGPHRVRSWRTEDESMPADVWVACLPFKETREYIKRILAYTLIYEWRLGRKPTPMSLHLWLTEPYSAERHLSLNQQN